MALDTLRIEPLARDPALAKWLAERHHAEWGSLMQGWTLGDAMRELEGHGNRDRPPLTLVAFDAAVPVGSVSLVDQDAPEFAELSPWLASLWVTPDARGQGIGGALIDAALRWAASHGWSRLHLFTPAHGDWYAARGWQRLDRRLLSSQPVDILAIDTGFAKGVPHE